MVISNIITYLKETLANKLKASQIWKIIYFYWNLSGNISNDEIMCKLLKKMLKLLFLFKRNMFVVSYDWEIRSRL